MNSNQHRASPVSCRSSRGSSQLESARDGKDAALAAPPFADERLLTIEQLSERIQYSAEWIRLQVRLGRIPAIRFNARAWRFHWPTVLHALQKLQ
jgi:hypothetical protein